MTTGTNRQRGALDRDPDDGCPVLIYCTEDNGCWGPGCHGNYHV